jgi:hypothetical protein
MMSGSTSMRGCSAIRCLASCAQYTPLGRSVSPHNNAFSLAGPSPRGCGEGGAGRSGLRPVTCDLNLAGARTPRSTGFGPLALGLACAGERRRSKDPRRLDRSFHHAGAGLSETGFAASGPGPRSCVERPGAWLVWPPCRARRSDCGPPAPSDGRPCSGASQIRGRRIVARTAAAHTVALYTLLIAG